jgi:hypothetical protein
MPEWHASCALVLENDKTGETPGSVVLWIAAARCGNMEGAQYGGRAGPLQGWRELRPCLRRAGLRSA